jgi:hypothetical protein
MIDKGDFGARPSLHELSALEYALLALAGTSGVGSCLPAACMVCGHLLITPLHYNSLTLQLLRTIPAVATTPSRGLWALAGSMALLFMTFAHSNQFSFTCHVS